LKIFIPIKENSQRVKGKNFRKFLNEPLYKHTLLKLKCFDVFIDTDSNEIFQEIYDDSRLSNVTVFKRRDNLIGDEVSVCDLIHSWIKDHNIDGNVCQLHVTSPFLRRETIINSQKKLREGFDSVVACNKLHTRLWRKERYGFCPVNHNPIKLEQTQDLPAYYEENSLFYIFSSQYFLKTGMRVGVNPFFYESNFPENIDIDTEDDWSLAVSIGEKYR
jgi:CMP-N-acetylneuraminic acid synthetase